MIDIKKCCIFKLTLSLSLFYWGISDAQDFFERLPRDIFIEVLFFMSQTAESIRNLSYTNKYLHHKINDENLTQQLVKKIIASDALPEPDALIRIYTKTALSLLPKALEQTGEYQLFCDLKKIEYMAKSQEFIWDSRYTSMINQQYSGLYTIDDTNGIYHIRTPWNIIIEIAPIFKGFGVPFKVPTFIQGNLTVHYDGPADTFLEEIMVVAHWMDGDNWVHNATIFLHEIPKITRNRFFFECSIEGKKPIPLFHKITAIQQEKVTELSVGQLPKYRSKVIWNTLQKMYADKNKI